MAKKTSFADLVVGHTFTFVERGERGRDNKFKCSFCGGAGIHWVKVRRDDGVEFLIGNTCLTKVGLGEFAIKNTSNVTKKEKANIEAAQETLAEAPVSKVITAMPTKKDDDLSVEDLDEVISDLNSDK